MTIDSINIETVYSAYLLEESINSVLEYPSLKKPLVNDWAEFDGLEVDLTNPVIDKKEVSISLLIDEVKIDSFVTFLMSKTYRDYYFEQINETFKLRFIEVSGIDKSNSKCAINLKLSNDQPLNYTYQNPLLTAENRGILFNGKNIAEYGFIVLNSSEKNLLNQFSVKDKLEIESKFMNGSYFSEQQSKRKEINSSLYLFSNQTIENFKLGYRALFYNLVQPNIKVLTVDGLNYNFYYDKCSIDNFIIKNNMVWCSFQIKIIMI